MNPKKTNVKIAEETLEILKEGYYLSPSTGKVISIADERDYCVKNAILYDNYVSVLPASYSDAKVEVVNETTAQAAQRLLDSGSGKVIALNFANATTPGGGFLYGANAQEEDLARCSALYASIRRQTSYYNNNVRNNDDYYTHDMIYSPDVVFFRDKSLYFLEKPFKLSIITAPAPNLYAIEEPDYERLESIFTYRINKLLNIALYHNYQNIVLGAWGCGAFGNDPNMVASIFKKCIKLNPGFKNICFAVYDTRPGQPVFETFKNILG